MRWLENKPDQWRGGLFGTIGSNLFENSWVVCESEVAGELSRCHRVSLFPHFTSCSSTLSTQSDSRVRRLELADRKLLILQ